jgi:hypothetical protein
VHPLLLWFKFGDGLELVPGVVSKRETIGSLLAMIERQSNTMFGHVGAGGRVIGVEFIEPEVDGGQSLCSWLVSAESSTHLETRLDAIEGLRNFCECRVICGGKPGQRAEAKVRFTAGPVLPEAFGVARAMAGCVPLAGLANLGNTCFFNVIAQVMSLYTSFRTTVIAGCRAIPNTELCNPFFWRRYSVIHYHL